MKIVKLQAENFKILQAVEIAPDGNVVTIGGKNGQGKSSVLDAVWVALAGRAAAPPKPIRNGTEQCRLRLDLGELIITRTFTAKEGGQYTDTLKVERDNGDRPSRPQQVIDELLGQIGFDPFEFVQMEPADQAKTLLEMVPLPLDLEEHAEQDTSDFTRRRDVNRDAAALKAQIDAIPEEAAPEAIDRNALADQLARAADTNSAIDRERYRRQERAKAAENARAGAEQQEASAQEKRAEAARLIAQAEDLEGLAKGHRERAAEIDAEVEALPPLDEPVDTAALRQQLAEADETQRRIDRQAQRAKLVAAHRTLVEESEGYTKAMEDRAKARRDALAKAKMPIEGLEFAINEKGKPVVNFRGVPFEQASTAEQLRASTAIAMSANPELRVLRIKDGSLLDEDSMKLLSEMAAEEDFQLWIEVVGTGGVGVVIENGTVKGAAEPEEKPAAKPKAKKESAATDGSLL